LYIVLGCFDSIFSYVLTSGVEIGDEIIGLINPPRKVFETGRDFDQKVTSAD
jgi:hypothetical protein